VPHEYRGQAGVPCNTNAKASHGERHLLSRKLELERGRAPRTRILTDFILHTACDEVFAELAVTRQYMLSPERWKLFLEALDKPPVVKPQLQKLFSEPSVLERH
jgi:uncharacterized protein (DUF1778 family)